MLPIKVNSLAPLQTAQDLACSTQEHLASAPPRGRVRFALCQHNVPWSL